MPRLITTASLFLGSLAALHALWPEFLSLPSLCITMGGTLTVIVLTFSWEQIRELGAILRDLFRETAPSAAERVAELQRLAQLYRVGGPRGLESQEDSIADPFLARAVRLLVDLRREEDIRAGLEADLSAYFGRFESARQVLLTTGRLLPAFGLIGTLIGLVLLLSKVGDLAPRELAPALSIAILTTLYGAVLANVVVLPLAAKLQAYRHGKEGVMQLSIEGAVLIARGEGSEGIERGLGTFLPWQPPQAQTGWLGFYRAAPAHE